MLSLLEKIKHGKLWTFHGGIHPSIKKASREINYLPNAELPNELVIPVVQHIGEMGELLVNVGDLVLKGQALTQSDNPMSPPIHAPTSGQVSAIEKRPAMHPAAMDELSVVIKPDGCEHWLTTAATSELSTLSTKEIRQKIHQAGITGMGGAGFPSAVKSSTTKPINYLIINGAECEPFIQADDALMQVKAKEIVSGISVLAKLLKPELILFAIEDDKHFAILAIKAAISEDIQLRVIPTLYPSGGERQLIKLLTGMEVPTAGLPADIGVIVHNIGTCFAIKRAVLNNEPLIERVVTLAGAGFPVVQNLMVKIGTPVHSLLKSYSKGMTASRSKLIIGGPMMGFTLPHAQIPVTKNCNAILLDSNDTLVHSQTPQPCIRCGLCADACPSHLLPQSLYWHAKAGELDKTECLNIMDCIECGACDYVCPSEIPLVLHFRQSKAQLRQQRIENDAAAIAKSRFEFREMRLERDKLERAAKHKAAAEKRIAMMKSQEKEQDANSSSPASTSVDTIAAAVARAKAKKQLAPRPENQSPAATPEPTLTDAEAQERAEQRAKRKEQAKRYKQEKSRAIAKAAPGAEKENTGSPTATTQNPAVATAIARAKAKKAATQASTTNMAAEAEKENTGSPTVTKQNPAVAAAIARAKAKKAAAQASTANVALGAEKENTGSPTATKQNPAVAAAIARAKAKKAAAQNKGQE